MENQEKKLVALFQQLGKQKSIVDTPDFRLKDAVFSTIDATSVIADIVNLFTLQFVRAQAEVVDALPTNDYGFDKKERLFNYLEKKMSEKRFDTPENDDW
ncbi:MAG: hypothetical protein U5L45_02525 [Saprospiraceae bacterium]|nr:hypothetical protein [Saprospiraceae bacterium]